MRPKKPLNHQSNLRIFAANSSSNPLDEIGPEFQQFVAKGDLKVKIRCVTAYESLEIKEKEFITKLTEGNMKCFYEQSENGWNEKQKEKEFRNENARFLFCSIDGGKKKLEAGDEKCEDEELIAFVHFRFELDDEQKHPVVYCYEIQVCPSYQSHGIGKFLMQILYKIGSRFKMNKIMLTCFKHNDSTFKFYSRLGYGLDVCSPSKFGMDTTYEILSMRIKNES